jgi:hypothetical protein
MKAEKLFFLDYFDKCASTVLIAEFWLLVSEVGFW